METDSDPYVSTLLHRWQIVILCYTDDTINGVDEKGGYSKILLNK